MKTLSQRPVHRPAAPEMPFRTGSAPDSCPNASGRLDPRNRFPLLICLAGVIIGVAALPQSILKADFKQARAVLARIDGTASAGANKVQADFAAQLEAAIAAAGPLSCWLLLDA